MTLDREPILKFDDGLALEADPVGLLVQLADRDHLKVDLRVVLNEPRDPALIVYAFEDDHLARLSNGADVDDIVSTKHRNSELVING